MPTQTFLKSGIVLILSLFLTSIYGQTRDTTALLGQVIVLFDSDQSIISESYKVQIDQLIGQSDSLEGTSATIEAHTDNVGNEPYNLKLSKQRAESIHDYLKNIGFQDSIAIQYFGEAIQVNENTTSKGRAENRRAIFKIYRQWEIKEVIKGKLISGRVLLLATNKGIDATLAVNGKDFKSNTRTDSLGSFQIRVPENTVLQFQAIPDSEKYERDSFTRRTTRIFLKEDILFELPYHVDIKPNEKRTISGVIADEANAPLENATLKITSTSVNDSIITDASGRFEFQIPSAETVQLSAYLKDYFYAAKEISPTSDPFTDEFKLTLPRLEKTQKYVAGELIFMANEDVLLPSSMIHLWSLANVVQMAKGYCFRIEGHINFPEHGPVGRDTPDFRLSERRAKRIYNFLLDIGVRKRRISWEGYGNWKMKYPKAISTYEGTQNRRVEVLVFQCSN